MSLLHDYHRRHILQGFLGIHERMAELESLIVRSGTPSPFSRSVMDLSPTECRVIHDHLARIRGAMLGHLDDLGIPLEVRKTSVRWALETNLMHLQVSVDDMGPKQLAGYGPLEPAGRAAVARIQDDLTRLLDRVGSYLRQGLGRDLSARLSHLDASRVSVDTLSTLERITTRWQLVEYRPTLEMIVSRLEKPCFELAVFGRVSSGKSSLLNHVAGIDVLPVGVTPVTAVPTRLEHGEKATAIVSFSETTPRRIEIGQLWEYASEEGNRGNFRHVTAIIVQVPSPRLKSGIVLVDTPGIGSLATSGAAEAIAYLPRCDLGIVLIDAASTLNQDDVALLGNLYEAGIPAIILLSKADLLSTLDRRRMATYIEALFQQELGLVLPVHPVSVVGADESLLLQWFNSEISPLLERHQLLVEASLRRKIASLSESLATSLETLLLRGGVKGDRQVETVLAEVRRLLDESDLAIRRARQQVLDWSMARERLVELILQYAAQEAVAGQHSSRTIDDPLFYVARDLFNRRGGMALELVSGLEKALRGSIDEIRRAWPLVNHVVADGPDLKPVGLPAPDLDPLHARSSRLCPWWVRVLPPLAVRVTRLRLEDQFGREIGACIDSYDRQLGAWIKSEIERLVEHFELEAAPVREQLRRLASDQGTSVPDEDGVARDALSADLRELRRAGQSADGSISSPEYSGESRGASIAMIEAK
jgi:GTP-binding protein EngB required for normal cell division